MKVINSAKPKPKFIKKTKHIVKKAPKAVEKKDAESGVIFISHLPHGFYDRELKAFFSQFGKLSRVSVPRSEKTGAVCGYGYLEFHVPDVAKIAAQTMNGYLVKGKILKCQYVPQERVSEKMFPKQIYNPQNCPKAKRREAAIQKMNRILSQEEKDKKMKRLKKKYVKRLRELGKEGVLVALNGMPNHKRMLKRIKQEIVDPEMKDTGPRTENIYLERIDWFEKKFQDVIDLGGKLDFEIKTAEVRKIRDKALVEALSPEEMDTLKKQINFYKKQMKILQAEGKISGDGLLDDSEETKSTETEESEMEEEEDLDSELEEEDEDFSFDEEDISMDSESEEDDEDEESEPEEENVPPLLEKKKRKRARKTKKSTMDTSEEKGESNGDNIVLDALKTQIKENEPTKSKKNRRRGKKIKKALNGTSAKETQEKLNSFVVEVDGSDDEIAFKTPPNMVKKFVKITPSSPANKIHTHEGKSTATEQSLVKSLFSKKKGLPSTPNKAEDMLEVATPQTVKLTPGTKKLGKKVKTAETTPSKSEEEPTAILKKTPKKNAKTPGTPSASSALDQVTEPVSATEASVGESEPVEAKSPKSTKTSVTPKKTPKATQKTPKKVPGTPADENKPVEAKTPITTNPSVTPKKTPSKATQKTPKKVPSAPSDESKPVEAKTPEAAKIPKTPEAKTGKTRTPKSAKRKEENIDTVAQLEAANDKTPLKRTVEEPQAKELFKKVKVDSTEQTTTPKKSTETPVTPSASSASDKVAEETVETKAAKSPKTPKTPKAKIDGTKTPKSTKRKADNPLGHSDGPEALPTPAIEGTPRKKTEEPQGQDLKKLKVDPTELASTPARTPKRAVKKTPKVDESSTTPLRRSLRSGKNNQS